MAEYDGDNVALLAMFYNDFDAQMAKNKLQDAGIPAIIDNEIFASVLPVGVNGIGALRLMVRSKDIDRARHILEDNDGE